MRLCYNFISFFCCVALKICLHLFINKSTVAKLLHNYTPLRTRNTTKNNIFWFTRGFFGLCRLPLPNIPRMPAKWKKLRKKKEKLSAKRKLNIEFIFQCGTHYTPSHLSSSFSSIMSFCFLDVHSLSLSLVFSLYLTLSLWLSFSHTHTSKTFVQRTTAMMCRWCGENDKKPSAQYEKSVVDRFAHL